jgi:dihydrofolate synthase/folylpolyglutamate synthase
VIPSSVTVLTSVGLEHTRWLGPTIADIATEKLDVLQPGTTLVLGPDLEPDAIGVA